ncbi:MULTISPECIES: hypothetical protein [unclassified Paenibacillus]|nr:MULTISPECIES: hypothetical protein [unclassified Paenibacillus]MCM3173027.1 hypothetical protein [Paenibacillus sp. MER 99-2]
MTKYITEITDLMRKYPRASAVILSAIAINLIYTLGKNIGTLIYQLIH